MRTRAGDCLSSICDVTSGVVQSSTLAPKLSNILTGPLLRKFTVPMDTFANDVQEQTKAEVQAEVDKVISWSDAHDVPLSIENIFITHCR